MSLRRRTWSTAPRSDRAPSALDHPATAGLELFEAASTADHSVDGYARWQAEKAAEREAAAAAQASLDLPRSEDESGYQAWKAAELAARRELEQRWGLPLGRPVRVRLRCENQERQGILRLARESSGQRHDASQPVRQRLSLGGFEFSLSEVEQVTRL
jgi:hypothetical protein